MKHKIHFIGIGGIGVSYLAQWYLAEGWRVSGSDLADGPIIKILRQKGIKIHLGRHKGKNIPQGATRVIYTLAAPSSNPERLEAKRRGIPELSHTEALGEITKNHYTIAIAGSHGKSTTTALAGIFLRRTKLNPTILLGTMLKELGGTNCYISNSPYLLIEADEWKGGFWNYRPQIAILTNIDREHLDFYKSLSGVKAGFKRFLKNLPSNGIVIANADDPVTYEIVKQTGLVKVFYSLQDPLAAHIRKVMKIPGEHNVSNALAVGKLAKILGIPQKIFLRSIASYRGAWRRFEYRKSINGAKIYDDYAHHPTEVNATLTAAKSLLKNSQKLWCVFQPHQYRRLNALFREFATAFDQADRVLILPVYAVKGREGDSQPVNSQLLTRALTRRGIDAQYIASLNQAAKILQNQLSRGDICLLMGAGDIINIHKHL